MERYTEVIIQDRRGGGTSQAALDHSAGARSLGTVACLLALVCAYFVSGVDAWFAGAVVSVVVASAAFLAFNPVLDATRAGRRAEFDRVARAFDIALAIVGIILLSPLFLAVSLLILVTDPGPIIFSHVRLGRGGKPFRCFKFRTMVTDAEQRLIRLLEIDSVARMEWARDHKLSQDPRMTRIGHMLRRTSLDELPTLLNVLRGEMSLVGPRPITPSESIRYGRYFGLYASVKPGITGLAEGRPTDYLSYRRIVARDVVFIRNRSIGLYWRILVSTVPRLLLHRGR